MKVLSTNDQQPAGVGELATASMSTSFRSGLVGVSSQTALVFGRMCSSSASARVRSTNV
jgi:hypothetical protein